MNDISTRVITEEEAPQVHLRLVTHNARLVDARKEQGLNAEVMAQLVGISRDRLRHIETLKDVPTQDEMLKFSCILKIPDDFLFPETLLLAIRTGVFSKRTQQLTTSQVISLTQARMETFIDDGGLDAVETEIDKTLLSKKVAEVLLLLTPREAEVIKLRFGLETGYSLTSDECGEKLRLTGARIRQIQEKALRKLRHPVRSRQLRAWLLPSSEYALRE